MRTEFEVERLTNFRAAESMSSLSLIDNSSTFVILGLALLPALLVYVIARPNLMQLITCSQACQEWRESLDGHCRFPTYHGLRQWHCHDRLKVSATARLTAFDTSLETIAASDGGDGLLVMLLTLSFATVVTERRKTTTAR